ncbi:Testis-expressed sequence 10 protein [Chamberlinius hualienensis]
MAKSSRKKKLKKADFQKVKLKLGRKLQKGNVVDTTFKAKKIVIKEQLRISDSSQLTDHDLKDCLRRLSHYNDTMRLDAVKNLNEMLSTNSSIIKANIHQLIEKLSQLFTDNSSSVRKMNVKALTMVISYVNDEQMIPFFPIIVTHLRCAATHLMQEVQKDALLVVDVLVDRFPRQVRYFSKNLLEDIVSLITNHGMSGSNKRQTKSERPLTSFGTKRKHGSSSAINVKVSSKFTSVSWHLQLCYRLEKILSNICKNMSAQSEFKDASIQSYKWESSKDLVVSHNYLISTKKSSNSDCMTNYFENLDQLKSVISNITPLLYEMWIEAGSLNEAIDHNKQSNNQQLETYCCILKLFKCMWLLLENWKNENEFDLSTWFVKSYGNEILTYCFKVFPHVDNTNTNASRKFAKGSVPALSMSVQEINLLSCEVMFGFTPWVKDNNAKYLLDGCINYVMDLLNTIGSRSPVKLEILLSVVKRYLRLINNEAATDIFKKLMGLLSRLAPETTDFNVYLTFMTDLWKDSHSDIEGLSSWFTLLPPSILKCNAIPWSAFYIMKRVGPKMDHQFLNSLALVYPQLMKRLPDFQVENGNVEAAQRITVDMLYWLPSLTNEILASISKLILEQTLSIQFCQLIIEVVINRYRKMNRIGNSKEDAIILSFLWTISIGCSRQAIKVLHSSCTEKRSSVLADCFANCVAITLDLPECVKRQEVLTEMALKALSSLSEETSLNIMSKVFFEKFFSSCRVMPLRSVHSLCKMASQLWQQSGPPTSILTRFSHIIVSYLELLANDKCLSEFVVSIQNVMKVPGQLPQLVCNQMLLISQNAEDQKLINTLGEMTCILAKHSTDYGNIIEAILDSLKGKINVSEDLPQWYAAAKYEVRLHGLRRK